MEEKSAYKIVIVGAGPAGLATALFLLKGGEKDILVIDKCAFPRYKCCAGYVTQKTRKCYIDLGVDFDVCDYTLIRDFKIVYKNKNRLTIENKSLYTNKHIDRVQLDYELFKTAKERGIEIWEKARIASHDIESSKITLEGGRRVGYQKLIFADGTTGFGARYQKAKKKSIAFQAVFETDDESAKKEEIQIHFGVTKRGYGWISTYNGVVNIGFTDVFDKKADYPAIFEGFMRDNFAMVDMGKLTAAYTPYGVRKGILFGNVYYVGDAVGACDPMTLSGLRYAIRSGQYCAEAITTGKDKIYLKFLRKLKKKFGFMKLTQKIFYIPSTLFMVLVVGCKTAGKLISKAFNHYFVDKK